MHLRFLGTGNTDLPKGRDSSLLIINGHIMVDCPPDCLHQLRRASIDPAQITVIIFTHWHYDHVGGWPMFALARRKNGPPLHIYGPSDGESILRQYCQLGCYLPFVDQWLKKEVVYHANDQAEIEGSNISFERFPVKHFDDVQASGYLFTNGKTTFMHTGDSAPCDAISSRVAQCQVVIIEMGLDRPSDFHFCPDDIKALAAQHPDVTFLVTHTFCDVGQEPWLGDNVRHMQDGDQITI